MSEEPKKKAVRRRTKRRTAGPTMVEVAKEADVSVFTVSAVLNGKAVVSDELRTRVQAAIVKTGYKRNTLARSLKTGQSMTIGLVLGDITNPFYTDVTAIIQRELHKAGYAVMLCGNNGSVALQDEHIELLRDRMVDGLIMSPTGKDEQLRATLKDTHIPVVLIDRILDGFDCDSVVLDNRAAVIDAMNYLISLGHRRIGFVSGKFDTFTGAERLAGYKQALHNAGIPFEPQLVEIGNFRSDEAYNATLRLMTNHANRPTALFSSNNVMVIGVMKALRDLNIDCPTEISVAGLDDFPWADAFKPQLTTVAQPVSAFGEHSARMLLERISGQMTGPPRHMVLKGELHVRQSCRPLLPARIDAPSS